MAFLNNFLDRRRNPWKGVFYDAFRLWRGERGHARLYDYLDLPEGGVVFDFGDYKGKWTDMVLNQQPDCTIHLFEPHPRFAADLRTKYKDEDRVKVYDYALGSQNGELHLPDEKNASSAVADQKKSVTADVVSVERFFEAFNIPKIHLVKMNIEGGEYDLLPALIKADLIGRIDRIQVQFHLLEEGMIDIRDAILTQLEHSHDCVWSYPFVWEEWLLRCK